MSSTAYDVHEVIVTARPVAGVHAQVPRGRVAQEFGRHLDQVYAAARAGAVQLDGQNIFIYRAATRGSADRRLLRRRQSAVRRRGGGRSIGDPARRRGDDDA